MSFGSIEATLKKPGQTWHYPTNYHQEAMTISTQQLVPAPAPRFDYSVLDGVTPGTDDYGIARLKLVMDFMSEAIDWCLEAHVYGQREGKIPMDQGLPAGRLLTAVMGLIKLKDEDLYPLASMPNENDGGKPVASMLLLRLVEQGVEKGFYDINPEDWTLMPKWDVAPKPEPEEDELKTWIIDGVEYPLVSQFSPEGLLYWAEHKDEFLERYPNGRHQTVVNSARHWQQDRLTATSHEFGESTQWFYTVQV